MLATVLDDKYELIRLLGEGGMGAVYEARHVQIGRHVAIKIMGAAVAQSEEARRRFLREAQVAGTLDHENICPVTDMGESADGVPYLVMPLLKGHSLAEEIESRQGPLSPERSVGIVCQMLAGLEVAHAAHVLHRDLKPDNVFLVQRPDNVDRVQLLDFGISKILNDVGTSTNLTGTGMVVGTPAYLSPEQAMATVEMDERVDVYGAAVVLYQLLTGRRPFEARSYNEMIVKICTEPFALPHTLNGQLDADLERVLLRGMARDPDERWPTARAFRQALIELSHLDPMIRSQPTELLATGPAAGRTGPKAEATGSGAQRVSGVTPTLAAATAETVLEAQSAEVAGLVRTPTAAGQVNLANPTVGATTSAPPSPAVAPRRGGLWGGIFALVGVLAGAGLVLLYLSLREDRPRREAAKEPAAEKRLSAAAPPMAAANGAMVPAVGAPPPVTSRTTPRPSPAPAGHDGDAMKRVRPKQMRRARKRPRRRVPPRPSTAPSGGKTARLSTIAGGKIYRLPYIRAQMARLKSRINRCFAAAQFDGVRHQFTMWRLKISAKGSLLTAKSSSYRPVGKGLSSCVIRAFHSISWKAPNNVDGGWFRVGLTSRIPRARTRSK